MLLYATTTSERASKGQGGNKYIHLAITDEAKQVIYERITLPHPEGYLVIEPREQCAMVQKRHGGGYHYPFATAMTVFEEIKKGNQQKGE